MLRFTNTLYFFLKHGYRIVNWNFFFFFTQRYLSIKFFIYNRQISSCKQLYDKTEIYKSPYYIVYVCMCIQANVILINSLKNVKLDIILLIDLLSLKLGIIGKTSLAVYLELTTVILISDYIKSYFRFQQLLLPRSGQCKFAIWEKKRRQWKVVSFFSTQKYKLIVAQNHTIYFHRKAYSTIFAGRLSLQLTTLSDRIQLNGNSTFTQETKQVKQSRLTKALTRDLTRAIKAGIGSY